MRFVFNFIKLTLYRPWFLCSFPFLVKFLEVLRPFISVLPEVAKPERRVCLTHSPTLYKDELCFWNVVFVFISTTIWVHNIEFSFDFWRYFLTDTVSWKSTVDSNNTFYFPGLLSGVLFSFLIQLAILAFYVFQFILLMMNHQWYKIYIFFM